MGKFTKIILLSSITILGVLSLIYLLVIPNVVDLNTFAPQIKEEAKKATGLDIQPGKLDLKTNINLSITVSSKSPSINYDEGDKLLELENLSVNVPLLPLLFKELQVKSVKVESPKLYLTRLKDKTYKIEKLLNLPAQDSEPQPFTPVIKGLNIDVNDYVIELSDNVTNKNFFIKGDKFIVSDFNPEKFIGVETAGKFLIENTPAVNFNVKVASDLPAVDMPEKETEQPKAAESMAKNTFDPIEGILKYNLRSDIVADIKVIRDGNIPNLKGFLNLDKLSLSIDGNNLPDSYGKFEFLGKGLSTDSKFFITPDSYISLNGIVKDIAKQDFDIEVKSSDIKLADIKKFALSLADAVSIDTKPINNSSLAGNLQADFRIKKNNYSGYLNLSNVNLAYKGLSQGISDLNAALNFQKDKILIEKTYGNIGDIRFDASGFVNSKNYADVAVNVPNLNLKTIYGILSNSHMLKDLKAQLSDISGMSGSLSANARIKGDLSKEVKPEIEINVVNPALVHKALGTPINLTKGLVSVAGDNIEIKDLQANIIQTPIYISGKVKNYTAKTPAPEIKIEIPKFELSSVYYLTNSSLLDEAGRKLLYDLKNIKGSVSAVAAVDNFDKFNANIKVKPISLLYAPMNLPVYISGGNIDASQNLAEIKDIKVKISNSVVNLNGDITNLLKSPNFNVLVAGDISSDDVKKYSPADMKNSIVTKGDLPLFVSFSGTPEDWGLLSQLNINNINYLARFEQVNGLQNILNISLKGNPKTVELVNTGLFASKDSSRNNIGIYNIASASKLIDINGKINNYSSAKPDISGLKVALNKLNLYLIQPEGSVQVNGNLNLLGSPDNLKALGELNLKNINIPESELKAESIDISLKEKEIIVNTGDVNLMDSKLKLVAILENKVNAPFIAKEVEVSADFIDSDKLNKKFPPVPNQDTPLIIKKGVFKAKELVASALSHKDIYCEFTLNPLNTMRIRNLKATTAGGSVAGTVDMNLKTSQMSADIAINGADVDILATQAANLPNEIAGLAKANVKLSTWGWTPEQVNLNTVGRVDFTVEDGKLNKIASINHLLKAKNLFKNGLTKAALDEVAGGDEVQKTNHFKYLKGILLLNKGTVNIPEMYMQGSRLSMFMSGYTSMLNNEANLQLLGKASGKVVKQLGPVTDVSVNKLMNQMGGFGQILAQARTATQYPNIDKIPSLLEEPMEQDKRFAVTINGNLQSPSAVKFFEWID